MGGGYGWSVPPETDESDVADRQRLLDAMAVLHEVIEAPELLERLDAEDRAAFFNAAGDVFCPDPDIRRRRTKLLQQQRRSDRARRDDEMLSQTGIRTLRSKPVFTTPDVFAPIDFEQQTVADDPAAPPFRETMSDQHCYICKSPYREIHHFYDQLCTDCAALNYAKRSELADMTGMVVLLTGGRVKIGYQAGIKLLRCGAELIVATRFPRDAAQRYAAEPDFGEWGDRLEVFGLDLRHTPSVEAFCSHILATRDRLDAVVNNACQTVRRPPGFYEHMMAQETAALASVTGEVRRLVGSYEALRRGAVEIGDGRKRRLRASIGWLLSPARSQAWQGPRNSRRRGCSPRTHVRATASFRPVSSTRTCSRSTCAGATRGGSCFTRCHRSS